MQNGSSRLAIEFTTLVTVEAHSEGCQKVFLPLCLLFQGEGVPAPDLLQEALDRYFGADTGCSSSASNRIELQDLWAEFEGLPPTLEDLENWFLNLSDDLRNELLKLYTQAQGESNTYKTLVWLFDNATVQKVSERT